MPRHFMVRAGAVRWLATAAVLATLSQLTLAQAQPRSLVDARHVQHVRAGLGKDQVRLELGNPHFDEGLFGVREWNYAFNMQRAGTASALACQFTIEFEDVEGVYRIAATHWNTPECAAAAQLPAAPAAR